LSAAVGAGFQQGSMLLLLLLLLLLQVLGKNHVIKGLEKCDFTPIYDHLMAERDKKKLMTKEVSTQQLLFLFC
jgi:hypothetical protein